ncbi:MAG: Flp pilus assembly protein CpaB [Firmicutes bacterium]|nr:Flp pilus assembly protein CpaB [Bacillota bacterium]
MKTRILLIISIIFGLLAALGVRYYLTHLPQPGSTLTMGKVVVAKANIPARTVLTAEMLEKADYPSSYFPTGSTEDTKTLEGAITVGPVMKGEPVLRGNLASTNSSENGLAFRVPPGRRAISLAIDEVSGISGMVSAGDRVDVFGTIDVPDPAAPTAERRIPAAVVAVYDVEVLAIGRGAVPSNDAKAKAEEGRTATLSVPVEEAQRMIMLADKGKARLVLRSPADRERPSLPVFTLNNYLK